MPHLLALRLRHFEKTKDASGCRQTAEMWEKLNRTDADSLYTAGQMRAVTAAVLKATAPALTRSVAGDEAGQALAWLKRAIAAGYNDVAKMKNDDALLQLRERDDFLMLIADLEKKLAEEKNQQRP